MRSSNSHGSDYSDLPECNICLGQPGYSSAGEYYNQRFSSAFSQSFILSPSFADELQDQTNMIHESLPPREDYLFDRLLREAQSKKRRRCADFER